MLLKVFIMGGEGSYAPWLMFTIAYAFFIFALSGSPAMASTSAATLLELGKNIARGLEGMGLQIFMALAYLALTHLDKTAHAVLFFGLAALINITLSRAPKSGLRHHAYMLAFLFAVAYGLTDEVHQAFVPGRTASIFDVLANTIGAAAAQVFIFAERVIRRIMEIIIL